VTALLVAFAVVAALNWWSRWTGNDRLELVTKPLATVLVIGVALTAGGEPLPTALAVAALVLCLVGDVALLPAVDRFIVGLGAFLLGHLVFVPMLIVLGLDRPDLAVVALAWLVPVDVFAGWRIVVAAGRADPGLRVPVAAYLAVISTMALVAWATGIGVALVGATSFVASDSILGWRRFVERRRWMAPAIMATYHLALVGLTMSLAAG
jgi:uncharacterized membrane protein YhhN